MTNRFRVTYDIVTDESAEYGDVAESGFLSPGNWHHDDAADLTLRDAVSLVGRGTCYDNGRWFSTADEDVNYRTGEHETRSVHPPRTVTAASYNRLRRVFCGR